MNHGTLGNLESLRSGAAHANGVIHLAFIHDFSNFASSLETDLRAIETIGEVLESTGKPFITTAHVNGAASDNKVLALAKHNVRTAIVSLAPSAHGKGDKGFVPRLINKAREKDVFAYIGGGSNHWLAVHRLDAATLYRPALEKAPAGSRLEGVGDESVPFRNIANVIGEHLNVPVESISREDANDLSDFWALLRHSTFRDRAKRLRNSWDGNLSN